MLYYLTRKDHIEHFRSQKYIKRSDFPCDGPPRSITFCTTCMNRLNDLKQTFLRNVKDNEKYPCLEMLLLDYGSSDELSVWVKSNLMNYIASGRVTYYRVEATQFRANHSRNISFRLAKGEIIANVDADNFTQPGFAHRVNQCAIPHKQVLIVPENFLTGNHSLLRGRFAMYKKDIEMLRGFDEDLDDGYGHDDLNFAFRAMLANFRIVRYESKFTHERIHTPMQERSRYMLTKDTKLSWRANYAITHSKICKGQVAVNQDGWGKARVTKNFQEELEL